MLQIQHNTKITPSTTKKIILTHNTKMAMKQMIRFLTNAAKCPWAIGEGTRVNVLSNMT